MYCVHPDLPPTVQMFPMEYRGTRVGMELYLPFLRSGITGETEEAITRGNVSSVLVVGGLGNAATPPLSPLWCWNWDLFQKWLILTRQLCSGPGMSELMHQIKIWHRKIAIVGLAVCWSWVMIIKKLESERKRQRVTIIHCLIIW